MLRWRHATPADDETIVAMCLALNAEDPGEPVAAPQIHATLAAFRAEPIRGRAIVAVDGTDDGATILAYALLVSFWSNEYGGEMCTIDELYVAPSHRNQGLGGRLFDEAAALWGRPVVALQLEVHPNNDRARALYARLGFRASSDLLRRRV